LSIDTTPVGRPGRPGRHTPGAWRAWEAHFALYRTIWKSNVLGAFVQPLLYLVGMGVGVGTLVDRGSGGEAALGGLTYFEFLAPALLATTGMMVTVIEGMWPVLGGFKWWRTYHAQAATPLTPTQIAGGTMLWQLTKALISVGGVAAVLVLFTSTRTWGLIPATVFGALTGVAFSAPMTAFSARVEAEYAYAVIQRFVIMPLFLFGGAFYPIDQLPGWMQPVAMATPLWHGVELCRNAVVGTTELVPTLVHVGYLAVFIAIGWILALQSFRRKLGE